MTTPAPRLALAAITRHYGPAIALDGAHVSVAAGEVHALLGENGAGKSTLMKIAYGLEQPDEGTLSVDGTPVTFRTPRAAIACGIGMVQQHFALVDAMTVAENVALGGSGPLNLRATVHQIRAISADAGLPIDPDAMVRDLPVGAQQRVEIIKALAGGTRTLILDEPTAVLAPQEVVELLAWTRRFAESGGTVVLIAHKLREVLRVADRVTVLRRGRTTLTCEASAVTEATLADAMLGEAAPPQPIALQNATGPARRDQTDVIVLSDVTVRDAANVERLRGATLLVRSAEIVGVAAVEGSGQRELLRVMAGRLPPTSGRALVPATVGFVPEDRHRDAIVLDATLTENVALRNAVARRGIVPWTALGRETTTLMTRHDIRARDASTPIRTLSGGNQQKLVLGRELAGSPAALVVENPTRGLDIRATAAVHTALRAARAAGAAVVVYSSDLDELLSLADRVVVVSGGTVRSVAMERESVGRAMLTAER